MIVTHTIEKMDLAKRGPAPSISVVQDDRYSRNVAISVFVNSQAVDLTGMTVLVRFCKPDGTGGNYDTLPDEDETPAGTIDGNIVTVALAPQVCTVPGRVQLVVCLISGEQQLHAFVIDVNVQANPGLQVTSENYFKITGALADSGWEPNKILGTDENGNVITMDMPEGGYTDEDKAEMVDAVLDELPIAVTADGYTDISGLRQPTALNFARTDNTVTISTTLEGGKASSCVATLDEYGLPSKIVVSTADGDKECVVTWEGF